MRVDIHHYIHLVHDEHLERRLDTLALAIANLGSTIMTAISDFAAAVQASFDAANASIAGIQGDVTDLKAQIDALQNSSGAISPEDQALLDDIQSKASDLATKVGAIDALTPPPNPPTG